MSGKTDGDPIVVHDRGSRRRFMRVGGRLLAAAGVAVTGSALAADCDQGGAGNASSADQDDGENADSKGCQNRNIVSENQPQRTSPVSVTKIKA